MGTYFHGTTIDNAIAMYTSDFRSQKPSGTWKCSDDLCYLYLWSLDKISECEFGYTDNDCDEEESIVRNREVTYSCIQQGFESAVITAALNNVLKRELVVFEFEFNDELDDDYSCPNMVDTACMIHKSHVSIKNIKHIYVCFDGYEPMYRVFHLRGLVGHNEHINDSLLTDREEEAIKAVTGDFYPNEDGFEWDEVESLVEDRKSFAKFLVENHNG